MPTTSTKKRTPQKTRRNSNPGINKKRQGRAGGKRTRKAPPTVIANSIFALTLADRPGVEVMKIELSGDTMPRSSRFSSDADDYTRMYSDLLKVYLPVCGSVTGSPTKLDPLASGLNLGVSLTYVIKGFTNNILPKDFNFNIDRHHSNTVKNAGEYYFTIYRYCPFDTMWLSFEVKYMLLTLKTENRGLHDIFLDVISQLMRKCDIGGWWNGGMSYAEYGFDEHVAMYQDEAEGSDDKEMEISYQEVLKVQQYYKSGAPAKYEQLFKKRKKTTPQKLLAALSRSRSKHPIKEWMISCCNFIMKPGCVSDFIYPEMQDQAEYYDMGLDYDQQAAVIWDHDDEFTKYHLEGLDAIAQEGVREPVINYRITPETTLAKLNEIEGMVSWPAELNDLWQSYETINEKIRITYMLRYAKRKN